jgi:uncharacterized protein YqjF (DUF2071 family)
MSFLTAEWRKLAIANYEIDKSLLAKYIPAGTQLDLWNDTCYVSLIGFMFLNTKLLGMSIPFHTNFEEVNLRFYVKRFENGSWKRGVVFIKEIVPRPALTFIANTIYNENYETLPMEHVWISKRDKRIIEYRWKKGEKWNYLKIHASTESYEIEMNSETEFITEHYWGYAKGNKNKTIEYEVTHPKWKSYTVDDYDIDVDFRGVYGKEFEFLRSAKPKSVMLAEGSQITVERSRTIRL